MQMYLADSKSMHTVESILVSPTVRLEFDQAVVICGIGEGLSATKSKALGGPPRVMPIEEDDWFFADRVTFLFRSNSLYNRRYHQRRRMKRLLGENQQLVGDAKSETKEMFLRHLTDEQIKAIHRVFHVGPAMFWRAAKGKPGLISARSSIRARWILAIDPPGTLQSHRLTTPLR